MKDEERLPVRIPVLGIAEAAAVLQYERLTKGRTRHCANRFVHAAYQGNNLRASLLRRLRESQHAVRQRPELLRP